MFDYIITLVFLFLKLKIINLQYKSYSAIPPALATGTVVTLLMAEIIICYPSNNCDDTDQRRTLTAKELEIKKKVHFRYNTVSTKQNAVQRGK